MYLQLPLLVSSLLDFSHLLLKSLALARSQPHYITSISSFLVSFPFQYSPFASFTCLKIF